MSFLEPKDIIQEGDAAILYISINNMHAIDVFPTIVNKNGQTIENVFQTTFGALKVRSLIGVAYGTKVELSRGWAYVLRPSPELWTQTLPHRTQIIYTPDASMILFQLEIRPGSVVIESGTGSGSLSHYFMRAVKPFGHLHTFDFHEKRVEMAREEFKKHGLSELVTVYHRDACQDGFTDELNGKADAVFLDLPSPHLAVPHALNALKDEGGRFCSFSPCIEQSQKCCIALAENGFIEIVSMETLQIEEIVKTRSMPIMDLECLKYQRPTNSIDTNEQVEINKSQRNIDGKISITKNAGKNDKDMENENGENKIMSDDVEIEENSIGKDEESKETDQKHHVDDSKKNEELATTEETIKTSCYQDKKGRKRKHEREMKTFLSTSLPPVMPGHTGYLTFASLPPLHARY